jgi:hypothetical protein
MTAPISIRNIALTIAGHMPVFRRIIRVRARVISVMVYVLARVRRVCRFCTSGDEPRAACTSVACGGNWREVKPRVNRHQQMLWLAARWSPPFPPSTEGVCTPFTITVTITIKQDYRYCY